MEEKLKGTQTEKNIREAFSNEAQALTKYYYFANQARKAGEEKIARLFEQMAKNETEHAKVWFQWLNGGLGEVEENLESSAQAENWEWTTRYPAFAETARQEGFELLEAAFERVAAIENDHEKKFQEALVELRSRTAAEKAGAEEPVQPSTPAVPDSSARGKTGRYICLFCGNREDSPLEVCPLCGASGAYTEVREENKP